MIVLDPKNVDTADLLPRAAADDSTSIRAQAFRLAVEVCDPMGVLAAGGLTTRIKHLRRRAEEVLAAVLHMADVLAAWLPAGPGTSAPVAGVLPGSAARPQAGPGHTREPADDHVT